MEREEIIGAVILICRGFESDVESLGKLLNRIEIDNTELSTRLVDALRYAIILRDELRCVKECIFGLPNNYPHYGRKYIAEFTDIKWGEIFTIEYWSKGNERSPENLEDLKEALMSTYGAAVTNAYQIIAIRRADN